MTPLHHPSGTLRFLALGDSYTIGEGVAPEARWPNALARRLRTDGLDVAAPTVVAVTGWTTDELAAGIDRAEAEGVVAGPYDLVTLLIGVNDQYRGRALDAYRTGFRALLRRAIAFLRESGELGGSDAGRVVVVSIPDWGVTPFAEGRDRAQIAREIDAFNAAAREETEAAGARFVDVTALSRTQGAQVVGDRLHPNGAAYAAWTDRIEPEAKAALGGA